MTRFLAVALCVLIVLVSAALLATAWSLSLIAMVCLVLSLCVLVAGLVVDFDRQERT